jgi:hypothetical protein
VGPLTEEDVERGHPLLEFKSLVLEIGPDAFRKLSIAASLVLTPGWLDEVRNDLRLLQPRKIITSDFEEDDSEEETTTGTSLDELKRAFPSSLADLSLNEWGQVIAYVERYSIEIVTNHPELGLAVAPERLEALARQTDIDNSESDDDDGDEVVPASALALAQVSARLLDDPAFYNPPSVSLLVYPPAFNRGLSHSCQPTSKLSVEPRTHACKPPPFPHTVNLVSLSEAAEDDRAEGLKARQLEDCECQLCSHAAGKFVSPVNLRALLDHYKKCEDYTRALQTCIDLLAADPRDASALLERARITSWLDENGEGFAEREALLREASELVDDSAINAALAECDAYYRNDVGSERRDGGSAEGREILDGELYAFEGLLDEDNCRVAVAAAEEWSEAAGGWTTARHYAVPTTDVMCYKIPAVLSWLNGALEEKIFPALYSNFGEVIGEGRRLRVFDAFLVKYDFAEGQKRLPLHNDQSLISLTIALNSQDEYEGGGTFFVDTGEAVVTGVGGVVAFAGYLEHSGWAIRKGVRYIVAAFLYAEDVQKAK